MNDCRLASGMKTEGDLAKKVISSVENYSHFSMIGKFQFFYGHNMFNGGCKCRNHITFADSFYRMIV